MNQCTAKAKGTGERCKRPATPGMSVCRVHGGLTPHGTALPQTKHGRYSKYLPARLSARYHEALQDPNLLALREEVALLDARIGELLGQVDTGESGRRWRQLAKQLDALRDSDPETLADGLATLAELIAGGQREADTWADIAASIEQRRRLVDTEGKRLQMMQQTLTVEQTMLLLSAVVNVVTSHVSDRQALAAISRDLERLISVGAGSAAEPAAGDAGRERH